MANSSLASKLDVSYKGSGRSKYIKLGIAAGFYMEIALSEKFATLIHSLRTFSSKARPTAIRTISSTSIMLRRAFFQT